MSSVLETHELICPQCGRDDGLDVVADVAVRLTPDGSDADIPLEGGHHWNEHNGCHCSHCLFDGNVSDFKARIRLFHITDVDDEKTGHGDQCDCFAYAMCPDEAVGIWRKKFDVPDFDQRLLTLTFVPTLPVEHAKPVEWADLRIIEKPNNEFGV